MERATPFAEANIYHDIIVGDPRHDRDGLIDVRHLIVKRELLDAARTQLERMGLAAEGADCWETDGEHPAPINFLAPALAEPAPPPSVGKWIFFALSLLLASSAVLFDQSRNTAAIATLDQEIAASKASLQALRAQSAASGAASADLAALHAYLKSAQEPGAILAELTRVVPDDAYLTELRLDKEGVNIAGFASKAASLVPTLGSSHVLAQVEMTAPLTYDTAMNKEQFRIGAKLASSTAPVPATGEQP